MVEMKRHFVQSIKKQGQTVDQLTKVVKWYYLHAVAGWALLTYTYIGSL